MPTEVFLATTMMACLLRLSSVSMSTTMEIAFDCSFCIRLLLLGCLRACNFRPNNNQTFIVKREKYTSTIQKGPMWFFRGSEIPLGRVLVGTEV